jgi:sialic acid synthase SpsE
MRRYDLSMENTRIKNVSGQVRYYNKVQTIQHILVHTVSKYSTHYKILYSY